MALQNNKHLYFCPFITIYYQTLPKILPVLPLLLLYTKVTVRDELTELKNFVVLTSRTGACTYIVHTRCIATVKIKYLRLAGNLHFLGDRKHLTLH